MSSFIIEFERRYDLCKKSDMSLPDAFLSFKLLNSAGLSETDRQLALTAAKDLKFLSMKSALNSSESLEVYHIQTVLWVAVVSQCLKQESVCHTKSGSPHHRSTGRSGFNRGSSGEKGQKVKNTQKGTNPLDRYGIQAVHTKCAICGSVFHWVKDCPHKEDVHEAVCENQEETRDCTITLLVHVRAVDPNEVLMCEAFSTAVVDTACTKTFCGQQWLNNYIDLGDNDQKLQVKRKPSDHIFRFGDGQQV